MAELLEGDVMPEYEDILKKFKKYEQEHVLNGYEKLFTDQKEQLLADCERVDFGWIADRWKEFSNTDETGPDISTMAPSPVVTLPCSDEENAKRAEMIELGEETLRQGKVAAFLVAGGQGTRLGFTGPKGCYPVGPISQRSLFQWHAEQILARSRRYGKPIPWYIMTSRDNDRDTKIFFDDNNYFDLPKHDVFFFQQDMVPCMDLNGKLLLSSPCSLAMNPTGHGGSLAGLLNSGAIKDMKQRGIEIISYFQVDNPLVTICDPLFAGWHVSTGSQMSCKVLEKSSPAEKIGVVCFLKGKPAVVEYIDLDEKTQAETGADGKLKYWAGSIAIHMIDVGFAEKVADKGLPWHQSRKKVPYFAGNRLIKPNEENAIKFETFVFDALPFADRTLNLEVKREHEFAPVKNAEGVDSVVSCRQLLTNYFCEWLAAQRVSVPIPGMSSGDCAWKPLVEISPLYSLDAEELATKVKPEGVTLECRLLLG